MRMGVIGLLAVAALLGCGSDDTGAAADGVGPDTKTDAISGDPPADGGPSDGASEAGESYLSAEARAELAMLGLDKYRGAAVITNSEVRDNGVTKVTFDPDSGPICLRGDIFSLFYEDRGSDKTMLVLDGGGACWTSLCSASATVEDNFTPRGPASSAADNYFADWNIVFVPYCDGSVFAGDNDFVEEDGATRYHHGRQNLQAALDVAVAEFGDSTQFMITGFSAGGYGTMSAMIAARLAFPKADLFVVNDSGPGVQNPAREEWTEERLAEWKYQATIPASCIACDEGHGQQVALYDWMLERDGNVKISLLSYYGDMVIGIFFNGYATEAEYKALLLSETDPIHEAYADRFKRFMLPGGGHVVTGMWDKLTADGVPVKDWVSAMASGDDATWVDLLAEGP